MFAEQISKGIQHIYGAVADNDDSRILDVLRSHVGAEHILTRRIPATGEQTVQSCAQLRDTDLTLFDCLWTTDLFRSVNISLKPGQAMRTTSLMSAQDMMRHETYNAIIRPLDGGLSAFYVHQDAGEITMTAICRSVARDHDFSDQDLAAIDSLMPHVVSATTVMRKTRDATRAVDDAYAVLEAMNDGIVVLNEERRVIYANRKARTMGAGGGFHLSGAGVQATVAPEDTRLQSAIRAAVMLDTNGQPTGTGMTTRLTITRPQQQLPLTVRVVPGGALPGLATERTPSAILVMSAPGETDISAAEELIEQFGLTRREAELASQLCISANLTSAAAVLDITHGTARQYLKSIFDKTGVHSQGRLIQLLTV